MPCLLFSVITGVVSSVFVIAFKIASGYVVHLSESIYEHVQSAPQLLPFQPFYHLLGLKLLVFIIRYKNIYLY